MGYQNNPVADGVWSAHCATFDRVDKKPMTLGDIKASESFYNSTLQLVNEDCVTKKVRSEVFGDPADDYMVDGVFTWFPAAYLEPGMEEEGWYLVNGDFSKFECFNHLDLPFGESFCIYEQDEDEVTINYAGEVAGDSTFDVDINGVWNSFGNCSPVDLTLGQIKANVDFYNSSLQLVDDDCVTRKVRSEVFGDPADDYMVDGVFTWFPADYLEPGMEEEGWYLVNGDFSLFECFNSIIVKAGEGFVVYGQDENPATITIPSALK